MRAQMKNMSWPLWEIAETTWFHKQPLITNYFFFWMVNILLWKFDATSKKGMEIIKTTTQKLNNGKQGKNAKKVQGINK